MKIEKLPALVVALIVIQALCAMFFVSDVIDDSFAPGIGFRITFYLVIEATATIGLIFGIVFEALYLKELLRHSAHMTRNMRVATGALSDVIDDYFDEWGLTAAERDVALFAIKGLSNTEIAGLRTSSEGTIKAHMNAVFRKADVSGRNQLISLLVEDLMAGPLVSDAALKGN